MNIFQSTDHLFNKVVFPVPLRMRPSIFSDRFSGNDTTMIDTKQQTNTLHHHVLQEILLVYLTSLTTGHFRNWYQNKNTLYLYPVQSVNLCFSAFTFAHFSGSWFARRMFVLYVIDALIKHITLNIGKLSVRSPKVLTSPFCSSWRKLPCEKILVDSVGKHEKAIVFERIRMYDVCSAFENQENVWVKVGFKDNLISYRAILSLSRYN